MTPPDRQRRLECMNAPALQASLLTRHYGSTRALDGVSLEIAPGTSTAIMGASGSGKTTLLHVLAGILLPDSGAVTWLSSFGFSAAQPLSAIATPRSSAPAIDLRVVPMH